MEKPETVKHAALLWATAIVAGIVETVLAVSEIARDSGIDAGVWTNIGVRSTVYIGVFVLVANFVRGRRWARLADGEPLVAAVGGHGDFAIAFFVVRLAHIAAVLLATALMFSPSANRYFRMPLPATEPVTA
jgi:hypothetical protein